MIEKLDNVIRILKGGEGSGWSADNPTNPHVAGATGKMSHEETVKMIKEKFPHMSTQKANKMAHLLNKTTPEKKEYKIPEVAKDTPESQKLNDALNQFIGGDEIFRDRMSGLKYTEGAKYFFDNAGGGAHWFKDMVGFDIARKTRGEDFVSITLSSNKEKATVVADDGNGKILYKKNISYTDCPKGNWKFYYENGVMTLPQER